MTGNNRKYDDMIDMPAPSSERYPRMKRADRASQFAPFAALSGFEWLVMEESRITEERVELAEEEKLRINNTIVSLMERSDREPVRITYFVQDKRKSGGSYVTRVGTVLEIDEFNRRIILNGGEKIAIDEIIRISKD